jgi:hypothetical protein
MFSSKTPLKSPLVQGGTLFSSRVVPQGGMKNSLQKLEGDVWNGKASNLTKVAISCTLDQHATLNRWAILGFRHISRRRIRIAMARLASTLARSCQGEL